MNSFKIRIKNSCGENWNSMRAEQSGKFCFSCNQNVIDFTTMNDLQIRDYLSTSTGKICGRFRKQQLTNIYTIPSQRKAPWYNSMLLKLALTTVLTLKLSDADAQMTSVMKEQVKDNTGKTKPDAQKKTNGNKRIFSGLIVDNNSRTPLREATIFIGKKKFTTTNKEGKFVFEIPPAYAKRDSIEITFTCNGYTSVMRRYSMKEIFTQEWLVLMDETELMMMGDISIEHVEH